MNVDARLLACMRCYFGLKWWNAGVIPLVCMSCSDDFDVEFSCMKSWSRATFFVLCDILSCMVTRGIIGDSHQVVLKVSDEGSLF